MPKRPRSKKPKKEEPTEERKDLPSVVKAREERQRLGITPAESPAGDSAKYKGKKHGDLAKEERDFPYRSKGGTWVHPKTGEYISPTQAKRIIRKQERRIIVRNLARETGRSEKDVRKKLKGVSTSDLVGQHLYAKKDPETGKTTQVRGHYKTTKKKDKKTGKTTRSRKVVTGPNTKGKKALRGLGIVAYSGQQLLRY